MTGFFTRMGRRATGGAPTLQLRPPQPFERVRPGRAPAGTGDAPWVAVGLEAVDIVAASPATASGAPGAPQGRPAAQEPTGPAVGGIVRDRVAPGGRATPGVPVEVPPTSARPTQGPPDGGPGDAAHRAPEMPARSPAAIGPARPVARPQPRPSTVPAEFRSTPRAPEPTSAPATTTDPDPDAGAPLSGTAPAELRPPPLLGAAPEEATTLPDRDAGTTPTRPGRPVGDASRTPHGSPPPRHQAPLPDPEAPPIDLTDVVRAHVLPALVARGLVDRRDRVEFVPEAARRPGDDNTSPPATTPPAGGQRPGTRRSGTVTVTTSPARRTSGDATSAAPAGTPHPGRRAAAAAGPRAPSGPPQVHVHIDRVVVARPAPAARLPQPAPAQRPRPQPDHDAYLARRREDR